MSTAVRGLVTLGESLGLIVTDSLQHANSARVGFGGAESNVAIGVRRLGLPATWVGRVGDDGWGDRIRRELRAEDVTTRAVIDTEVATAVMTKERRTTLSTHIVYHRRDNAGSRLTPEDLPAGVIATAGVVHLTGITPGLSQSACATVDRALELVEQSVVPVSFDVNHRAGVWGSRDPGPLYREIAARAAVVFAGDDEARLLTGTDTADPFALLYELAALADGDVVLKRGEHGCLALIDKTEYEVPAVRVAVIDTVGAGDAFVAGYLAELLVNAEPDQRLQTAVRCGAFACLSDGDWEGLPTRRDLATLDSSEAVQR